jgi:DNA-binding MarR family transcriptional regulator
LLSSRRKPNKLLEVYTLLENNAGWLSAEEINAEINYVKRTLQGILNKLVERKAVKKTRSLSDARVTLFSAIPVEKILMFRE